MNKEPANFQKSDRVLSGVETLMEVPPEKMAEIESKCVWRQVEVGDIIIDVNDMTTNVYFLVKGKLRVLNFVEGEQEVQFAEIEDGETFGEMSAIDLKGRSARVIATTPALLASLSAEDFRQLLIDCPRMTLALLKRFSMLIRTLTSRVTHLSTMSPHQRVYHELLRLSEPNTIGDGSWIIMNAPNHTDIASWAGAEKQVVAEAIGNLARDGVLERQYKNIVIRDRTRLQQLASL